MEGSDMENRLSKRDEGCAQLHSFQDIQQGSWHKEPNGRPVTVIMFEALLIFVDGIGLDVDNISIFCWQSGYFPGDYIPDVAIWFKTTEDNCVTSEDCPPFLLKLDYVICHMVSRLTNLVMSWSQG